MPKKTLTLYGNVGIDRMECPECKEVAFVRRGVMACCDLIVDAKAAKRVARMSEPEAKRKTPGTDDKTRILSEQDHRCFWCRMSFGEVAIRIGPRSQKMVVLIPCWDHVEPFAWSFNNSVLNFVAACSICNGIKSSKMFLDMEETRAFILARRASKGWK